MYFIQKCFHTKLQIVTLLIGLFAGILAFASLMHLSIIFWNYEYTYPENLFIFYNARFYNRTMYRIYIDYKDRMFQMCRKYEFDKTPVARAQDELLRGFPGWEVIEMGTNERKSVNFNNETTTELQYDHGNFSYLGKSPSVPQSLKRQVNEFSKQRALRYKRLSSTSSKCNASDKRSSFKTRYDSLSSFKRTLLPMGNEPLEEFDGEFGRSLHRVPRSVTEKPISLMDRCMLKVNLIVFEFNVRLNVGRKVLMGNIEDQVTTTVMMLQLIAYLIDIIFIIANVFLILGAGLLRSTYILPWMAFWWPFIIIHVFYIWVEWFLHSESSVFGLTITVFFGFIVLLIIITVVGFFLFWLVWCYYYLLFTPEEYMEQLSSISQLVVTGRNIRG